MADPRIEFDPGAPILPASRGPGSVANLPAQTDAATTPGKVAWPASCPEDVSAKEITPGATAGATIGVNGTTAGRGLLEKGTAPKTTTVTKTGNASGATRAEILFVGMNNPSKLTPGADYEIRQLRSRGLVLTVVSDSKDGPDKVALAGRVYDLSKLDQTRVYCSALGISEPQATRVAQAILMASPGARDEMAQIAAIWVEAEQGQAVPNRS
jgi:hypothetical protein